MDRIGFAKDQLRLLQLERAAEIAEAERLLRTRSDAELQARGVSLARLDRRRPFEFRVDTEFRRVMELCAVGRPDENPAWILPRMIDVYTELHREVFAHSVEAWLGGVLVGGLYGVSIGGAFFGESMFSRRELGGANASKLCLLELQRLLVAGGYVLLDSQEANDHMAQFGGEEIPFEEYRERLELAVQTPAAWGIAE